MLCYAMLCYATPMGRVAVAEMAWDLLAGAADAMGTGGTVREALMGVEALLRGEGGDGDEGDASRAALRTLQAKGLLELLQDGRRRENLSLHHGKLGEGCQGLPRGQFCLGRVQAKIPAAPPVMHIGDGPVVFVCGCGDEEVG